MIIERTQEGKAIAKEKKGQRSIAANRLIMLWNYLKTIAYDTLKKKRQEVHHYRTG